MENRNSHSRATNMPAAPPIETFEVNTPNSGTIKVLVEGHRSKGETVVLTVHDVGTNMSEMREFLAQPVMLGLARRLVWMHITVPGQEEHAAELVASHDGKSAFPDLQQLAEDLLVVLEQLNVTSVVLFGDGAGANILLRFAILAKERVLGAVLHNCQASSAGFLESQREKAVGRRMSRANSVSHSNESHLAYLHFGAKSGVSDEFNKSWEHYCDYLRTNINPRNLHYYMTAYFERSNLLPHLGKLSCPLLLLAGARSEFAHSVHSLYATIQRAFKNEPEKRRQVEFLRVDGVVSPMHEKPEKLAECIQYFLQGLGLLGSLSPVFVAPKPAPTPVERAHKKSEIIEFRSHMEEDLMKEKEQEAAPAPVAPVQRSVDDSVQAPRPPPGARGRRMSMQEYDVPRGPDSFRAYGAQRISGVRTPSMSE